MWRNVYEETESTLALILVLESRKKSLHIEYIPCIAHFPLKISFSSHFLFFSAYFVTITFSFYKVSKF